MCADCKAATITQGCWRQFNAPACIFCSARMIQQIGKLRTPTSEQITARRKVVLAEAIAWGHSEELIRKLVKGPMAVSP